MTISSFLLSSSLSTVCLSLLLLSSFLLSLVDCPSRVLCFSSSFSSLLVLLKGLLIVELSLDCELVKSIFHPFDDPFDDGVTLVGFVVGLLKFLTLATLVPFSNCMAIDGIYLAGLLYSIKKKSNTVTDKHFSVSY